MDERGQYAEFSGTLEFIATFKIIFMYIIMCFN